MLDQIKKEVELLASSEDFKNFKKEHEEAYLCSCFLLGKNWQIDFFSPTTKQIASFSNKKIVNLESKTLSGATPDLKELKLTEVKIPLEEALNLIKKQHPEEKVNESIIILQTNETSPIWNITQLTASFKMLHSKINAKTKEIIEEKISPMFNF